MTPRKRAPRERDRVLHMRDAAQQAIALAEGRMRDDLETDPALALALTRLLEIIGEAAKHVSDRNRRHAPGVQWSLVTGMRDRLAHGYFDVDNDVVWDVVLFDLPTLLPQLEELLAALDSAADNP